MKPSTTKMRIRHEQMAKDPCGFRPFLLVPAHAEEVNEPVQVRLQVALLHAGKAKEVAPEPRAQVVHELHCFQVRRVGGVGLVGLVSALGGLHERRMRPLFVVRDHRAWCYVREQRVFDPLRGRLPVAADHGDDVLECVDCDRDADPVLGQPALLHEVGAPDDVGVREVELVDPDSAAQHEPVLAAVDRGEGAAAPLEGGLVRDLAHLGDEVDGGVAAHARDGALPGRELLLAVFENGSRERGELRPAFRAQPPLVAGGSLPVLPAVGKTARRAARARPPQRGGLVERSRSDKVPALAFGDGGAEGVEGVSVKGRHHAQIRVDGNHGGFLSAQAAIQPGMSPNIGPDGHLGKSMFGRTMVASSGRMRTLYPHASILSDHVLKWCSISTVYLS